MSRPDCAICGLELPSRPGRAPDEYAEDDVVACSDCGAANTIFFDEDMAYVGRCICKHGKSDEEPCDECEIEHGGGVGEAEL